jgi:hypothetical protein
MKPKVHFIGCVGQRGDTSACGVWEAENMTGDMSAVTCSKCRHTRDFKILTRDPSQQFPTLAAYRKPRSHT